MLLTGMVWDGMGWDEMEMKQKNIVFYLHEVEYSVLIKKKLLDSQFHFTWVLRDQLCVQSHLLSLSQNNIVIFLHNLKEAELKKSAEDADREVDTNHSAKPEDVMFFLLRWHFATCLLMWTF